MQLSRQVEDAAGEVWLGAYRKPSVVRLVPHLSSTGMPVKVYSAACTDRPEEVNKVVGHSNACANFLRLFTPSPTMDVSCVASAVLPDYTAACGDTPLAGSWKRNKFHLLQAHANKKCACLRQVVSVCCNDTKDGNHHSANFLRRR